MSNDCDCQDEVARLHQFFQDWFRGTLDSGDFGLCEAALAPGFTIVTPGGELITRDEILEGVRRHRGGEPDEFRIETVARHCQRIENVHIVAYEERQTGARSTIRLSTAVLSDDAGAFKWHSVHETWVTV
ncbi:MAG: DUF4440 domain-containing protein [Actinomycetota bacterium]|nr:DUF4440 domain-containing protein [Actinomycetota bacterium]